MTTLRKALKEGKLKEFAEEREAADPPGNEASFRQIFEAMAGKSKEAPEASTPDNCDD